MAIGHIQEYKYIIHVIVTTTTTKNFNQIFIKPEDRFKREGCGKLKIAKTKSN